MRKELAWVLAGAAAATLGATALLWLRSRRANRTPNAAEASEESAGAAALSPTPPPKAAPPKAVDAYKEKRDRQNAMGQEALRLFREHEYERAAVLYKQAIELLPESVEARTIHYNRGCANVHLSRFDEALADFSSAIAASPKYYKAYLKRATVYSILKEYEAALIDYEVCQTLHPETALDEAMSGLLREYHQKRCEDEKEKRAALPENHDLPSYVEIESNASSWTVPLHPTVRESQEELDDQISMNPDNALAYYKRAVLYLGRHLYEEAEKDLQIARDIGEFEYSFECSLELATLAIFRKKYDEAKELLEPLLGAGVQPRSLLTRGFLAVEQGESPLEFVNRALEIDPSLPDIYMFRGDYFMDKEQLSDAMADFRRAASLKPEWSLPHFYLAVCLGKQEAHEEMAKEQLLALECEPKLSMIPYFFADYLVGRDDAEGAAEFIENDRYFDAQFPLFHLVKGDLLLLRDPRNAPQAMECFKAALALDHKCFQAYLQMFQALMISGDDLSEALIYVQKALELVSKPRDIDEILRIQLMGEIRQGAKLLLKKAQL